MNKEEVSSLLFVSCLILTVHGISEDPPILSSWPLKVAQVTGAALPNCATECRADCILGLEVCLGQKIHTDTPTDMKNPPADPNDMTLYVYCECKKSTIQRQPGVYCGPNTKNRVPVNCPNDPVAYPWVDGQNTNIPGSQGTVLLDLIAQAAAPA